MTYPDPNVQAWAQYYAQGGTDPTGAVYFISVPGVKEGSPGTDKPAGQSPVVGSTAPLNIQRAAAQQSGAPAPGPQAGVPAGASQDSLPAQHEQPPQAFYQANPHDSNASQASLSSAHSGPYPSSPYSSSGHGPVSPGEAPAWSALNHLSQQFGGMNVNADTQGAHPNAHGQGVGAPA
jgi:signal transducing adaptor molecule